MKTSFDQRPSLKSQFEVDDSKKSLPTNIATNMTTPLLQRVPTGIELSTALDNNINLLPKIIKPFSFVTIR